MPDQRRRPITGRAAGTLPWLLAHMAVLAALGWLAYLHTLRRARREGGPRALGAY